MPENVDPVRAVVHYDVQTVGIVNFYRDYKQVTEEEVQEWLDGTRKVLSLPSGVTVTFYPR